MGGDRTDDRERLFKREKCFDPSVERCRAGALIEISRVYEGLIGRLDEFDWRRQLDILVGVVWIQTVNVSYV